MPSVPCKSLQKQGYQFFSKTSSAALKPCMWCKRALAGGEMCYKHQFYGIDSHRCVQLTPTLRCNQRCLFCWRSFEHEAVEEEECPPETILAGIHKFQKKALAGYNAVLDNTVTEERWREALDPRHVAISLSGEPTLYSRLPQLIDLFNSKGYTTFLVSNGTCPEMLRRCNPFQMYVSLDAPDEQTYLSVCRPSGDYWERVGESLRGLGSRRSAVRITLVKGLNDFSPEKYAAILQDSGAQFVEVKGYMYLGYSRNRLSRENMPEHAYVRSFAGKIVKACDYRFRDENELSRVICLERER
ncbi:4-demethylwyosine synthase TYW1 [Methanoregula sp.]|uniref:4-demethylwyosine synthase TYW1 n=1 Tax=Methanoregula sp. TaxID=2052170 RepID=UPI003C7162BF